VDEEDGEEAEKLKGACCCGCCGCGDGTGGGAREDVIDDAAAVPGDGMGAAKGTGDAKVSRLLDEAAMVAGGVADVVPLLGRGKGDTSISGCCP
jgi:hypothetical protein